VPIVEDYESFAPTLALRADATAEQVGVRFSASVDGTVSGIRAYVGDDAGVSHTGYLWAPDQTLLATVSFAGEAVDGWRTATVDPAVALTARAEYRVTIQSSSGKYARLPSGPISPVSNGSLSSPASGGVHGTGSGYPDQETDDGFAVGVIFQPVPDVVSNQRSPDD
jgi:hypothetical protein